MTLAHESFAEARAAHDVDLGELRRLEELGSTLAQPQRGGELFLLRDARVADLASLLDDDQATVILGCIDDVAVGYAVARVATLSNHQTIAEISDLFVEPEARQVGVGEAMMNSVLAWAAEQRCRGVDATALPGDRHTKNFFESFGLVARAILVHRALAP